MFDNVCKFLAESFSDDFAQWLLGEPVSLSQLSPRELSLEPIRADALILLQSAELVLHIEFQTEPKAEIPFRMADYRLRVYRRYSNKRMHQVVIYLKPTSSELVYQDSFDIPGTRCTCWGLIVIPVVSNPYSLAKIRLLPPIPQPTSKRVVPRGNLSKPPHLAIS